MENDFFDLYESQSLLALEVGHNSVADWNIIIYERRKGSPGNWGPPVIHIQETYREIAFAKAHVALAEYLSEHNGGY